MGLQGAGFGSPFSWQDRSPPMVMGVLNVTPDSFSDGGLHATHGAAIASGLAMAEAGAAIVDVGGESTRPDAVPVPPDEECRRILPVIAALAARRIVVSVDTRNAATMQAAVEVGASIVNDVSGLRHDPQSADVIAGTQCAVILMHMRGTPATMRHLTDYDDVVAEIAASLALMVESAEAAGIARARIAIDPGIGFAKTHAQTLALLRGLPVLAKLGLPIVVGVSRKSFIGAYGDEPDPARRAPGSIAAALFAAGRGAGIVRVHDVAETVQALKIWRALTSDGV